MDDIEDVEETLERLQREWLASKGDLPIEEPFIPSYCYGCARTSGVAVHRKRLSKKQKKENKTKSSAIGLSQKQGQTHAKSKAIPHFKSAATIQASAKIKKKALNNLLGQKKEFRATSTFLGVKKNPKGAYPCEECGLVFSFSCNLMRHLEQHIQRAKEYPCAQCGQTFTVKRAYVQHVHNHKTENTVSADNVNTSDGGNTCSSDDVNTYSSHDLNTCTSDTIDTYTSGGVNTFTFESDRPYACYKCGKTFGRAMYLNQHMRVHNNARPFPCQFCTRRFKTRHHLRSHEKTHMYSKPYPCHFCEMSFTRNSYRTIHERIHTNERPFKCNKCDQAFIRNDVLRKHQKIHMES